MPVLRAQLAGADHLRSSREARYLGSWVSSYRVSMMAAAYVQADQIAQGQGAHGWLAPSFPRAVSTPPHLATPVTRSMPSDHGNQNLVHHKAGGPIDFNRPPYDGGGQLGNGLGRSHRRCGCLDDLHQPGDGGGVKEGMPMNLSARLVAAAMAVMEMEDAGGQDGLRFAEAVQLREDAFLDVQVLDGGLHHQIGRQRRPARW